MKISYRFKKAIKMSLMAAAMMCIMLTGYSMESHAQAQGKITAASAKIRETPDTNSNVLASVVKGDELTIDSQTKDSAGTVWYCVFVDGETKGYVRSDLIEKTGDGTIPEQAAPSTTSSETTSADANTANTTEPPATNTDVQVGVSTTVEALQTVGATVNNDNVRVRSEASTSSEIVTQIKKDTAVTITGQAAGSDGKTWYLVSFMNNSNTVTGFIRSDFVDVSGELLPVVEEIPEEQPVEEPEETEEPTVDAPVNPDYELVYSQNLETGEYEWYIYNNISGNTRYKLTDIIEAGENNSRVLEEAEKQASTQKIIIIVLIVVIVILALVVTLLLFKIRDSYYEDFEDGYEKKPSKERAPSSSKPREVRPASKSAARSAGSGQARPIGNGQPRPAGNGQARPTGNGQPRPAGSGQVRPTGNGQPKPAGNGQAKPTGNGQPKPAGNGQARPTGNGQPRPAGSGQPKPTGNQQENAKWQSKNFIAEDDEFEFEFLNWDGDE